MKAKKAKESDKSEKTENTLINNTKNGIKEKRLKSKGEGLDSSVNSDKFDMGGASSATDCTGIQQQAIMTHDEQENLKAVCDYGQPDI